MTLTVMTYNIKSGAPGSRLAAVARVVNEQAPDILALQELRQYDRVGPWLAAQTGLRPYPARSWLGQPVGLLVARHLRVLAAGRVHRPFHHAAAWVRVATGGGPLTVVGAHLDPHWGSRRLIEAAWLASFPRDDLALVVGDLNTLDPLVDHADRLARLSGWHRWRHLRWPAGSIDTRAVALLLRRGYVDLWRTCGTGGQDWTAPTEQGGGAEFCRMRLDYVFATRAAATRCVEARVVTGGETEWASDHYPVLARLDVSSAAGGGSS